MIPAYFTRYKTPPNLAYGFIFFLESEAVPSLVIKGQEKYSNADLEITETRWMKWSE